MSAKYEKFDYILSITCVFDKYQAIGTAKKYIKISTFFLILFI